MEQYELGDYVEIRARRERQDREARQREKRREKIRRLDEEDEMKFSHSIQFNAVPDWSSQYLAYSNLKKLCVAVPAVLPSYGLPLPWCVPLLTEPNRIYQLEKTAHQASTGDGESRPLVGVEDPEDIFRRALHAELDKITDFYRAKEAELNDETRQLLRDVEEFDGGGSGGRWYADQTPDSDNQEDSDDEEDDETAGLTSGLASRLSRRKSGQTLHSTGDLPATRERSRSLRRASTTLDDYAEQSFLYSTGIVLKKRVTALFVQLCELKSYIQLNKTGFGKVLKKFDKILHREMRAGYMEAHVLPAYPFRAETLYGVEDGIGKMEAAYAAIATQGEMDAAKKELRAHLREHVVWERNTVWRDMIGLERRAEAARIGRSLLGAENTSALLQGDDVKLPESREVRTPFGRFDVPLWLANSGMGLLVSIIAVFFAVLYIPILEKDEQQNCLALLVLVSLLWATEVRIPAHLPSVPHQS